MVAHLASTLPFDVTMVGPRCPSRSLPSKVAPVFPGYNVVRELASGGMGVVYEAYHRTTGLRVAIKTMRSAGRRADLERRFLGEVVAAQRIAHPSVVKVLDYGHDRADRPFLVMEFLEGECLAERVVRGDLTVSEFCQIAAQLVDVVAAAHRAGIVHRDIKPANVVVLRDDGAGVRIKLIDFGVAKFVAEDSFVSAKTAAGVVIGTPAYMSPEQCLGGAIDSRSDVYSIGCLLYELLVGRCPFVGTIADVLIAHRTCEPPPVAALNPAVPQRLALLVDRMLRKRPSERPASLDEVAAELEQLEHDRRRPGPQSASYATIPVRLDGRPGGRTRHLGLRLLAFVVALVVGAGAAAATIGM